MWYIGPSGCPQGRGRVIIKDCRAPLGNVNNKRCPSRAITCGACIIPPVIRLLPVQLIWNALFLARQGVRPTQYLRFDHVAASGDDLVANLVELPINQLEVIHVEAEAILVVAHQGDQRVGLVHERVGLPRNAQDALGLQVGRVPLLEVQVPRRAVRVLLGPCDRYGFDGDWDRGDGHAFVAMGCIQGRGGLNVGLVAPEHTWG